jgi:hypothetical protein
MNITSSAGCLAKSEEETLFPSTALSNENSGNLVPRGSIVEETAAIVTAPPHIREFTAENAEHAEKILTFVVTSASSAVSAVK